MQIVRHLMGSHLGNSTTVDFSMFFIVWLTLTIGLYLSKHRPRLMKAMGTAGGHVVAFAAIYSFGVVQVNMVPFKSSPWASILIPIIYCVVSFVLCLITKIVRQRIADAVQNDEQGEEEEDAWDEQCIDSENDFVTLAMGFMMSVVARYFVRGEPPPIEGEEALNEYLYHAHKPQYVWPMLGIGILCAVVLFFVTRQLSSIRHTMGIGKGLHGGLLLRGVNILQGSIAMTVSWVLFFWGEWFFDMFLGKHIASVLVTKVGLALFLSAIVMVFIYLLDFFADRGNLHPRALRHLINALGVLIGFSWEVAFDNGVESIAMSERSKKIFGGGADANLWAKLVLAFLLIGIALPAWRLYILTNAQAPHDAAELVTSDSDAEAAEHVIMGK